MTSRNDITGDKLKTKPATKEYRDNFDAIFNIEKEISKQTEKLLKEKENDRKVQESK